MTILSRPKDETLESFKAWIKELTKKLGGKETLTDEQYEKGWKKFWEDKK